MVVNSAIRGIPIIFPPASLETVPGCIASLLEKAGKSQEEVDLFIFHQANQFMPDHLRR